MYMYRVFPTRVYVAPFSLPQVRLMFVFLLLTPFLLSLSLYETHYRFRPGCCIPPAPPPFFISILMSIYRYIYIYIPTIYNNAETRICYPPRCPPFSPNIHITYTLKPCTYRVSINARSKYSTDARKLSPAFPAQHGTLVLIKTTTNAPSITSRVLCCSSHAPPPGVHTPIIPGTSAGRTSTRTGTARSTRATSAWPGGIA